MQCVTVKNQDLNKEREAGDLLSNLVIEIPLTKIPLVDPLLF